MGKQKRTPRKGTTRRTRLKAVRDARAIYSDAQLHALPVDQAQARSDSLEALSLMRTRGMSLTRAAREVGRTPQTVRAWTGPSIRKQGKRYAAKTFDKLVRHMRVLTPRGMISVPIFDSRVASKLGSYNDAVKQALAGKPEALRRFRGKSFGTGGKRRFPFITDMRVLKRLAQAGELPEYTIYAL